MSKLEVKPVENLAQSATQLGAHYRHWKESVNTKDDAKAIFFNNILTEYSDVNNLRTKTVRIKADSQEEAVELAKKKNPKFTVKESRSASSHNSSKQEWDVVLKEDPFFITHKFVNPEDNMVYERRVEDGPLLLDDELLKIQDPHLYERSTFELPWGEVVSKPFESLSKADQAKIKDYLYNGNPVIKLPAPRKAREDELADGSE